MGYKYIQLKGARHNTFLSWPVGKLTHTFTSSPESNDATQKKRARVNIY